MQSLRVLAGLAGLALAGAAAAAEPAASTPPARAVVWRCEGEPCSGGGPNAPSDAALLRECEQVVSVIGPVSRDQSRGRERSERDLVHCTRRATRPPAGE